MISPKTITAATAPLRGRAFLRITGSDRTRWLNGMLTNNIIALVPGAGCYNFLLNAQGRIQGDCTVFRDPDEAAEEFLLETTEDQIAAIQQHLDRFIIMDDVELMPVMDDQQAILLLGTEAAARLTALALPTAAPLTLARGKYADQPVIVIAAHGTLPRFELFANAETIAAIRTALAADTLTEADLEQLRILEGTPRFGTDIRNSETARDLPQETAQDARALHFNKGCYLGQEIVERIHSRGQVHRTLARFELRGDPPATLPAPLTAEEKTVGELTSVAGHFALGYIRREAIERRLPLRYQTGEAIAII